MEYDQPIGPSKDYSHELVAALPPGSSQPAAMQPFHSSSSTGTPARPQQQGEGPHSQPKPDFSVLEPERQWSDSGYDSLEGSPLTLDLHYNEYTVYNEFAL